MKWLLRRGPVTLDELRSEKFTGEFRRVIPNFDHIAIPHPRLLRIGLCVTLSFLTVLGLSLFFFLIDAFVGGSVVVGGGESLVVIIPLCLLVLGGIWCLLPVATCRCPTRAFVPGDPVSVQWSVDQGVWPKQPEMIRIILIGAEQLLHPFSRSVFFEREIVRVPSLPFGFSLVRSTFTLPDSMLPTWHGQVASLRWFVRLESIKEGGGDPILFSEREITIRPCETAP